MWQVNVSVSYTDSKGNAVLIDEVVPTDDMLFAKDTVLNKYKLSLELGTPNHISDNLVVNTMKFRNNSTTVKVSKYNQILKKFDELNRKDITSKIVKEEVLIGSHPMQKMTVEFYFLEEE